MEGLWLAFAFIFSSLLAGTAIPSLPEPFAYFPVMLMGGVLVMNRVREVYGAIWLVLSGIVLGATGAVPGRLLAYVVAAVIGAVLTNRVFAKRSIYALLGLGVSTGVLFVACEVLRRGVGSWFVHDHPVGMSIHEAWWTVLLLVCGLYGSDIVAFFVRRWVSKRFLVR